MICSIASHVPFREFWIFIFPIALFYLSVMKMLSWFRFHRIKFVVTGIIESVLSIITIIICLLFYNKKLGENLGNVTDFLWGMEMTLIFIWILIRNYKRMRVCIKTRNKKLRRRYMPGIIFWFIMAIPSFIYAGPLWSWQKLFGCLW